MNYLRHHTSAIIDTYRGAIPLSSFLKQYFKAHPILGSRDRKILSLLTYSWYRAAKAIGSGEWLDQLRADCSADPSLIKIFSLEGWLTKNEIGFDIEKLFGTGVALSDGIERKEWLRSMLWQPYLFIRLRKNRERTTDLLRTHGIDFHFISDHCVALPNGAKIDNILPADSYVVQDASSQRTGELFKPHKNEHWYDCCSGAGGKSLLLKDIEPGVLLTVSDKRESIMHNLRQRFKQYHLTQPETKVLDVADAGQMRKAFPGAIFDDIICDAPCTGCGTWARTPEQLHFFNVAEIARYAALQLQILTNAAHYLKKGGRIIYITCSIFRQENERVVAAALEQSDIQLISQQIINGIGIKADSMFVAVLTR